MSLEKKKTFMLATPLEWMMGGAVFLLIAALANSPARMMPFMMLGFIVTTFGLAYYRILFKEKISLEEAFDKESEEPKRIQSDFEKKCLALIGLMLKISKFIATLFLIWFLLRIVIF